MIDYRILKEVTTEDVIQIHTLLRVLSDKSELPTAEHVARVVRANTMIIAVDQDREHSPIVGMATLVVITQLVGMRGRVEDVAVLPSCGGKGIGYGLMLRLHEQARLQGVTKLALTSRPEREAANALYLKLGYKRVETNVCVIDLQNT